MDAMWAPAKYSRAYLVSFFYIFFLTLPHSISVQLAYPDANLKNGEKASAELLQWVLCRHKQRHAVCH